VSAAIGFLVALAAGILGIIQGIRYFFPDVPNIAGAWHGTMTELRANDLSGNVELIIQQDSQGNLHGDMSVFAPLSSLNDGTISTGSINAPNNVTFAVATDQPSLLHFEGTVNSSNSILSAHIPHPRMHTFCNIA
jgi:hypothetical protein